MECRLWQKNLIVTDVWNHLTERRGGKSAELSKFGMNESAILKAEATLHTLYAVIDNVVFQKEMGKQFWNHYVCALELINKVNR